MDQVLPIISIQPSSFRKDDWITPLSGQYALSTLVCFSICNPQRIRRQVCVTSYQNDMGIPGGFGSTLIGGLVSAMYILLCGIFPLGRFIRNVKARDLLTGYTGLCVLHA